jgi:hypothetical protein
MTLPLPGIITKVCSCRYTFDFAFECTPHVPITFQSLFGLFTYFDYMWFDQKYLEFDEKVALLKVVSHTKFCCRKMITNFVDHPNTTYKKKK